MNGLLDPFFIQTRCEYIFHILSAELQNKIQIGTNSNVYGFKLYHKIDRSIKLLL